MCGGERGGESGVCICALWGGGVFRGKGLMTELILCFHDEKSLDMPKPQK